MKPDESDPTVLSGFTRRRFLAVASAVAVAPLVPIGAAAHGTAVHGVVPASATPVGLAREATAQAVPMSVGYIEGSGQWPSLEGLPWTDGGVLGLTRVVPAFDVRSGDRNLIGQTAIITVHGLVPGAHPVADPSLRYVALDADLGAHDPASAARFFVWTLRTGSDANISGRSVFRMAVTHETRLGFDLAVTRHGTSSVSTGHLGIADDDVAGLRRGAYLLALDAHSWDHARALPPLGDAAWRGLGSIVVTVDRAPA